MRTASTCVTSFAVLALSFVGASCVVHLDSDGAARSYSAWGGGGETLRGSGAAASELREVSEFSSVEFDGAGETRIVIAPERSVRVTADDNLIEHVRTRVDNGQLVIDLERGSYEFRTPLKVEITTPTLGAVSINGSGDIEVEGLDGASFDARIAGSGSVVAIGRCDALEASIAGSGDLKLLELKARTASIRIAGSGDARVNVSETLDVEVAGSGDVRYRGTPKVRKSIAGSGSVARD